MKLDRRTVLRGMLGGASVAVALPALEAMLNANGTALANGSPLPTRFGVWFWGNGVKPDRWIPTETGTAWTPSSELEPLTGLRRYITPITGLTITTASHPHHSGMTGIMTGARYHQLGTTRDTIVTTFAGPSVDQLAADHHDGATPLRSLELGVARFTGTDEGSTFQHLSHNGPNNPNPSAYSPGEVYDRLFGRRKDAKRDLARFSVLDAVLEQAHTLEARLGATDRVRLDQHMSSIRSLERRLEGFGVLCEEIDGEFPVEVPDMDGVEPLELKNELMSDLLAHALACDLTRVFTVQYSTAGSNVVVRQVGMTDGNHYLSHVEPGDQPVIHDAVVFHISRLADTLQRLADTPEGDGNLLENSSILCTSELTDGQNHSNTDFPIVLAGLGSGRLVGDQHLRLTSGDRNASRAVLTALHAAGIPAFGFGDGPGYTDDPITEALAPK
ncbi:MAG: DUF1552 domain-containing protein [Myxococcota bacterium]